MIYRKLGNSGLSVSCIGLGTWVTFANQIDDKLAEDLVTVAYENGINFFDTAEIYAHGKAEILLGNILHRKKWRRSTYVVCTKLFWGGRAVNECGLSRKHIIEGLNGSLQRLKLDYVDIVMANKFDPDVPIEEVVRAFNFVINQGKALYWAVSRWSNMQIMEACLVAKQLGLIAPIVDQCEYNMFSREAVETDREILHTRTGITTIGWSPLGGGMYTGKYVDKLPQLSRCHLEGYQWLKEFVTSDQGRRQQAKLKELEIISDRIGATLPQMMLAWCLKNEKVVSSVLIGCTSVDQLYENIGSLKFLSKLSDENIIKEIDQVINNKPKVYN